MFFLLLLFKDRAPSHTSDGSFCLFSLPAIEHIFRAYFGCVYVDIPIGVFFLSTAGHGIGFFRCHVPLIICLPQACGHASDKVISKENSEGL